jgi:hypothetical protein
MWKYRGNVKELEAENQRKIGQTPDLLLYNGEIQQGAKTLEKQEFATITLKSEEGGTVR